MDITLAHFIHQPKENERFQLNVLENTDLKHYQIQDQQGNRYSFASQKIIAGDKIVLFTKSGRNSAVYPDPMDELTETIYIYYWGLTNLRRNIEEDSIHLIRGTENITWTLSELLYISPF